MIDACAISSQTWEGAPADFRSGHPQDFYSLAAGMKLGETPACDDGAAFGLRTR